MPPAGDGSLPSELNRINRFFTNPDRDSCSLTQGIGGKDTHWPFVDGLWSICLDTLQRVGFQGFYVSVRLLLASPFHSGN